MQILRNISVPVSQKIDLRYYICRKLKIKSANLISYKLIRRSLDARKRNRLMWQCNAIIELKNLHLRHPDILPIKDKPAYLDPIRKLADNHPFIIGSGPAGLFCALDLVEQGLEPWIFDQGECLQQRDKKVNRFWQTGDLDENSNIQFGEGGAGTYSDGKLTARNQDYYTQKVYDYLIKFGADPDININAHPHIGTDKLKIILSNIHEYLVNQNCRFFWEHKLNDLNIINGKLDSILINNESYKPEITILAIGNASRVLFRKLSKKITLENKPLACGFRIEHRQNFLNQLFYGDKTDFTITGPAEYRIKAKADDHSIFSFCMCPGGIVVNASSQNGRLVTNGMSWSKRLGKYGNSAIVTPIDFSKSPNPLAALEFQEVIEKKCFDLYKGYAAPAQRALDFVNSSPSSNLPKNTFLPKAVCSNLSDIYPKVISDTLKSALNYWDKRYPHFADQGILIAPETRTSSPVRILRNTKTRQSIAAENLYPIGEGSGYSSGIISSAADGIKLAAIFYS